MAKQPIIKFKDEKELIKLGEYYKKRLFLDNWTIDFKFGSNLVDDYGNKSDGLTMYNDMNREATIYIDNSSNEIDDSITKNPVELVLLHELLHCFYPMPRQESSTLEGAFYLNEKHKDIETMAKSILMIKYDLDFSWFKNY